MQIHFLTALWIVGDSHKTEVYENLRYRNRLKLVFSYDISNLILTISRAYLLIVVDLDYKTGYHYESITPFSEIKASLIWLITSHISILPLIVLVFHESQYSTWSGICCHPFHILHWRIYSVVRLYIFNKQFVPLLNTWYEKTLNCSFTFSQLSRQKYIQV